MTAPKEVQDERHEEYWADPKPFVMPDVPEPAELVEQCAAIKTTREYGEMPCGQCGVRRAGHFQGSGYVVGTADHPFVEWCDNADDPVLCKWEHGEFVPEASCPVHDPEDAS